MMTQHEGATFYTTSGSESTAESILGGNTARLRLWVSDSGNYNLAYTVALAKTLSAKGYGIVLDMHLSDTWTDPEHQAIPSGWPTSLSSLSSTLRSYVSSTLKSFDSAGVDLTALAIGNEVTGGFLFPTGQIKNNDFTGFATLFAAARAGVSDAVSAGVTQPKVMIHLDNGWKEATQTWWYKGLIATGKVSASDFDIQAVSYYPFYGTGATFSALKSSLTALANTYSKPVWIAETNWPVDCPDVSLSASIPVSASGQKTWVKDVAAVLAAVPNSLGQGLIYFEPAFINNTALGSGCEDVILFDVDWSTWPDTKVTARSSTSIIIQHLLRRPSQFDRVQQCSIENFHKDTYFLDNAVPITAEEFIGRRDNLAKALHVSNVDAFVLEPGYTFQYYANISQPDWEPWEQEERPFLMLVSPVLNESTGAITAKTTFLSPAFEEGRVRMLGIPSETALDIVTWEEHWNPYRTLKSGVFQDRENVTLMVDEEMRDFLVRGLGSVGFSTVGLGGEVEAVRQIKTPAEVELLRAVNTGTIEAVRAMRVCLEPGLTENQVIEILDNTLLSMGFSLFFDIVLFESNAALPHGGFATGDMVLEYETMVLIDVGAHYLGYSSDICRSFFIPPPAKSFWTSLSTFFWSTDSVKGLSPENAKLHAEKLKVWDVVLEAQTQAAKMFKANNTAASVDIAARSVINDAGYKGLFTHRLGHGIGIKAHESPYLNKGNHDVVLRPGMVFTAEPGIYIENVFGVRHEDIYLVKEDGEEAEAISGKRAVSPYEP
ncbi:hypothetical protein MBLNU459_g6490t1 [Dothideomycetes sp. NU459]